MDIAALYVEDDLYSREIMEIILRDEMGLEHITIFADSGDFLSRLRSLRPRPDVILLDIHVAPLGGFQMLALLRAEDAFQTIPVIALTASVLNEEVQQLKQAGFSAVIAKPIDQDVFPDLLRRILDGERIWRVLS